MLTARLPSSTNVSRHTSATSSSLVTRRPGRVINATSNASALGVIWTGTPPFVRRLSAGSRRNGPNSKTREGFGTYDHYLPNGQILFGNWRLKVIDRDTITVTNTYAEEETGVERAIPYVWRRKA